MTVQDLTPERLGPYRLVERLGEGGMGIVYLARDPAERMVAVKALRPGVAAEATARRRLAREVETMRRVHSPFVAEVIDADVTSDPPYIVTRYVPGQTLEDVVAGSGPLTGKALARLLAGGLAAALTAVHAAGVVHRDLKPGNVLILDGEPVVIDFGIAQLPEVTRLTMTGMFMGTPGYLAPEVIEGKQSGTASDVHSWGATVAYAATGRPPFGTGSFEAIFYRIVHGQPDLDTFPPGLYPMVSRALARDPVHRPAAAELSEWVAALDPAQLGPGRPGQAGQGGTVAGPGNGLPPVAGTRADLNAAAVLPAAAGPAAAGAAAAAAGAAAAVAGGAGAAPAWPSWTRPLAPAGDYRDLLPPVSYGPQAARPRAGPLAGPGGPGWQPPGQPASQARPPGAAAMRSLWSPLVIAVMLTAAAASVAFPVAGTAVALAGLIFLRAADITTSHTARRRSRQGSRSADPVVAAVFFPVAVCRSVLQFVLLAPLALLAGGIVAAITILAVQQRPLPLAVALGAGALIAVYGIGPGSAAAEGR